MNQKRGIAIGLVVLLSVAGICLLHRDNSSAKVVPSEPLLGSSNTWQTSTEKSQGLLSEPGSRENFSKAAFPKDKKSDSLDVSDATSSKESRSFPPQKTISTKEHADQRIYLDMNETVEVILDSKYLASNQPIVIRVEDGGVIDGKSLQPEVIFEAGAFPKSFMFTIGRHRGLYVLSIMQGQSIERLEFWAGSPLPKGEPGPRRNIVPSEVLQ